MLLTNVLLVDLFHRRLIDARYKWSTKVKGLMVDMIIVLSINVHFENLLKLISCPKWNETCTGTRMLIHDQWLLVKRLLLLIDIIVVDFTDSKDLFGSSKISLHWSFKLDIFYMHFELGWNYITSSSLMKAYNNIKHI